MDLQGMDFRLQNIFWSGSSATEIEILYSHLIMRILMSTFRCIDNIDYVIMYRHLQKDNFHLFSLICLMWLLKIRLWINSTGEEQQSYEHGNFSEIW